MGRKPGDLTYRSAREHRTALIDGCMRVPNLANGPAWFEDGFVEMGVQRAFALVNGASGKPRRKYGEIKKCENCARHFISVFKRGSKTRFCTIRCSKIGERNPVRRGMWRGVSSGRKAAKQTADKWFSLIVRARGPCLKCGTPHNLQCAHVFSRRYTAVRWDERNAVPLCRGCHVYFTHRPIEWEDWIVATIGMDVYNSLRITARDGPPMDLEAVLDAMVKRVDALKLLSQRAAG